MDSKNLQTGNSSYLTKPWVLIAKFDVKEECEAEWLQGVQEVIDAMRHEASFISTSICAHPSEPGKFMLFEVWKSREQFFETELNREYRRSLTERMSTLLRSPAVLDEWHEIRADYAIHVRR